MAEHRPEIGKKIKNKLRGEVGNKCANPGCANQRTHIHHIREWHVYRTHDERHMIAVCPACHDEIHYGRLPISDETLYQWKQARTTDRSTNGHLYVEPGGGKKVLLGSIAFTGAKTVTPFSLSPESYVSIQIEDDEITLVDLRLTTVRGLELIRIRQSGHYQTSQHDDVTITKRAGALKITVPCSPEYVPEWLIWAINAEDQDFIKNPVTMFEVEVLKPGLVKVAGIWAYGNRAIRVTADKLQFFAEGQHKPLAMIGAGEETVLVATGHAAIQGVPLFKL